MIELHAEHREVELGLHGPEQGCACYELHGKVKGSWRGVQADYEDPLYLGVKVSFMKIWRYITALGPRRHSCLG